MPARLDKEMPNELVAAIAKSISDGMAKKVIGGMEAGAYDVDEMVRIRGTFKLGEKYTEETVAKARPWALVHLLAQHFDTPTFRKIIQQHLTEPTKDADIKKRIRDILEALGETTETEHNGKSKFNGTLDVVDSASVRVTVIEEKVA